MSFDYFKTLSHSIDSKTGSVIFPASGESSLEVTVTLRDAFNTSHVVVSVGTAFVLLDCHSSGKGIGVGKVAELQNTLDVFPNWDFKYINAVMTDFVMEQGIKNNWHYRKWYSGVMELSARKSITVDVKNRWGSLFTSGPISETDLTYLFVFKELLTVIVTLSPITWAGIVMTGSGQVGSTSKTGVFEVVRGLEATNATYVFNYDVVGKWK
ncbi:MULTISPECIES: hypothetical protein [unclassified Granulicatella]|uniref:hypothetical protein n=1 Tax=unclassified Granulicatella TaxID=2630493 RepID=UPI0010748933|nr:MULTISPECIES: hypothetical protein [unclassified Granulicatella]MBF0780785.1 hypothetical protein [Granulicatella sp. 19428wC4_WM01]TFU93830.1 hypothetical protein E4T68_06700 [Granulicatella sp. WM01]